MDRLTRADFDRVVDDIVDRVDMPDGYSLDVATPGDLEGILSAARACFAYDTPTRKEIHYFLTRAHAVFFVIRHGRSIVGYTLLEANRRTRMIYNNTTCVVPACQGLGLGRIFYALKQRALPLLGYKCMTAHVAVDNKLSFQLFKKYGFDAEKRIVSYYEDGRDAYRLRLDA